MKTDFLAECNNLKIPLEEFHNTFCVRCLQKDCTRSSSGKSLFESRVTTWEERLFTYVPRMAPSDERYPKIQAQKFVSLTPESSSGQPSAWVDPRALEPTKAYSIPNVAEEKAMPVSLEETPVEAPPVVTPPAGGLVNTPNRPGQMLGVVSEKTVSDPWKQVQPLKPGEVVVRPGAKVKLGG